MNDSQSTEEAAAEVATDPPNVVVRRALFKLGDVAEDVTVLLEDLDDEVGELCRLLVRHGGEVGTDPVPADVVRHLADSIAAVTDSVFSALADVELDLEQLHTDVHPHTTEAAAS